jgi:hypothetical protein
MLLKSGLLFGDSCFATSKDPEYVVVPRDTQIFATRQFAMLSRDDRAEFDRLQEDPTATLIEGNTGWAWIDSRTLVHCIARRVNGLLRWTRDFISPLEPSRPPSPDPRAPSGPPDATDDDTVDVP